MGCISSSWSPPFSGGARPRNKLNLFHSYDCFSVGTNDTTRFSGLTGEDVSEVWVCYALGVYETQSNPQANRVIA